MRRLPQNPFRRLALLCGVGLGVALSGAPAARAMTLDPSHPVWSGPHAHQWARALAERGQTRVPKPRPHAPVLGRLSTAVGQRVLVIPVLPSGAPAAPRSPRELEDAWFGPGEGTVRGYWEAVSGGRLPLEGRVLPWVSLPGTLASDYFNVNDGRFTGDAGSRRLAEDALTAAADGYGDLRFFDDDGPDGIAGSGDDDGVLDLVVIVHPWTGWEVDPVSTGRAIVSLQGSLGDRPVPGTDLRADAFVVVSATGPLGVWVHEFGHLLGLEDLYDHGRDVVAEVGGVDQRLGGLGRWSLMASGTWGGGGRQPSGLDPHSRIRLGWDDTIVAGTAVATSLVAVTPEGASSLVVRPAGDWGYERFLIENRRRREGAVVDGDLPGSGVLVYRLDDRQGRLGQPNVYLELLQADGRDDLSAGTNDGDATDPFTGSVGADRLDGDTVPSTRSYHGDDGLASPVIAIGPAGAEGAHPVRVDLFEGPWLQLARAGVPQAQGPPRLFLGFGVEEAWRPEFVDAGTLEATGGTVAIEVVADGRPATVVPATPVSLVRQGTVWVPETEFSLRDDGPLDTSSVIELRLSVSVDGGTARTIALGVPVQAASGLERNAGLLDFRSVTLADTPGDTTRFERLGIAELPRDVATGWGLRRQGVPAYGNGVDVALVSPWLALDDRRRLEFWSRQDVETDLPGRAWDAGVVEVHVPDRGWRVLRAESRDPVEVWHASGAAVRGREGLGGDAWTWAPAAVDLPADALPLRIRFRFGSDSSVTARGWEIAGAGTVTRVPRATVTVRDRAGVGLEALADFDGDVSRLDQVRYRYRVPGAETWTIASNLFSVRDDGTVRTRVSVPETIDVFELALFAELTAGGAGTSPPLLLGSTGYRRTTAVAAAAPRVLENPARERLVLGTPVLDAPLPVRVFDVRGRAVARFTIPAGIDRFEWDPRAGSGVRLASGIYFVAPDTPPMRAVRFVWLK